MTEKSLQDLFYKYYQVLVNYAYGILKSESKAKDAVQDVFLKLWESDMGLIDATAKSLLFTMTRNACIDMIRKEQKEEEEQRYSMNPEVDEEEMDNLWLKEKIINSVRHLPPKCREIFTLSKMNGLTYAEIAEHLGISVKTVESQMYKAYNIIRENW